MVVSVNKWFLWGSVLLALAVPANPAATDGGNAPVTQTERHPFHVSVTEINHNAQDKTLEISCKLFTDDFEDALTKKFGGKIDLVNPKDRPAMDKLIKEYIHDHLQVKADNRTVVPDYLGYEVDHEAVYAYLEAHAVNTVKKIDLVNSILYDLFNDQTGINHVIVGGNRKSIKLDYPGTQAAFQF